jgi:energy-converting hydrogenase Eha subunit C
MIMNKDQIYGVIRTLAAAGFGFLAGKGYLDGATVEALSGAVATIAVAVWSIASKKPAE